MELSITYRYIAGIDISKKVLDIYLLDRKTGQGNLLQVTNCDEGFHQLGQWLQQMKAGKDQTILCSEHTGRYGEHLLSWTTRSGWPHAMVKTTALEKVGNEHHRKNDQYDAQMLADYGRRYTDQLTLCRSPKPAVKQIRRLRRERRSMVDRRTALKQKLTEASYHDCNMEAIKQCWQQQIALLTKHIQQFEERMHTLINQTSDVNEKYERLRTAPGVGKVVGTFWITTFGDKEKLNPRKIASRYGFAPHDYRSGSSVRKGTRSSGFGNGEVRRIMHQAARSVATHSPHYKEYYRRKLAEGKPQLLVINNIINKLIRLYCAMWNKQMEYDPGYMEKMKKCA